MLWLYRLLFLPGMLLLLPGYLRRLMRRGGFRENFATRLGAVPPLPPKRAGVQRIWLQAVSVGEVLAIGPLLEALRRDPAIEIYLTTTTTTGYAVARARYENHTIGIAYFPVDFWWASASAWRRVQPDLAILTEGERWPEHIHQAHRRGAPVLCVNARLSDRSFRRMSLLRPLAFRAMRGVTRVLAASELDAERFRALGFSGERVSVMGNLKLDVEIPRLDEREIAALRAEVGLPDGFVLLGSSTWPGEEAALLETLRRVRAAGIACRLLLVPRHAERRDELAALLGASEFSHHFRSRGRAPAAVDVAIADTTGELRRLTQLADVVFVGKSLPPHHEGQTPVEAAVLEKPILFGPGMTNFREIVDGLLAAQAARRVADPDELARGALELMQDPLQRAALAAHARAWHAANRGAVERAVGAVMEILAAPEMKPRRA